MDVHCGPKYESGHGYGPLKLLQWRLRMMLHGSAFLGSKILDDQLLQQMQIAEHDTQVTQCMDAAFARHTDEKSQLTGSANCSRKCCTIAEPGKKYRSSASRTEGSCSWGLGTSSSHVATVICGHSYLHRRPVSDDWQLTRPSAAWSQLARLTRTPISTWMWPYLQWRLCKARRA